MSYIDDGINERLKIRLHCSLMFAKIRSFVSGFESRSYMSHD